MLVASGLAVPSALVQAQGRGGLEVSVSIDSVWRDGATRAVGVRVAVGRGSSQQLLSFYLDSPAPVTVDTSGVGAMGSYGHWMVMDRFAKRRVTSWANAQRPVPAGEQSPRFVVRGQGVFGVVKYWTTFFQEPVEPDSMPDEKPDSVPMPDTTVSTNGPGGWTIGIIPSPPVESASAAASRLRDVISTLCTLGWISPSGVCNSLLAKVSPQPEPLEALSHELQAQRGKRVSEGAYWILVDAVAHAKASLEPQYDGAFSATHFALAEADVPVFLPRAFP